MSPILPSRKALREYNDSKLSMNPLAFREMMEEWDSYMKDKPKRPLHIIAWSFSPWHKELLKDTCFAACYIIKNALEVNCHFDAICVPRMTDWAGGADSTGAIFYGGHGLFTRNGIRKPSFYAFYFLNALETDLIGHGEGWVFTKGEGRCVGILYNYCHFSDLYANGEMLDVDSINRYRAFADPKTVQFSFQFLNAPKGQYRLHEVIVNRTYGSAFDKWVDMGASIHLVGREVDQLKQVSIPLYTKHSVENDGKMLEYSAVLEPHEIRLVELIQL